MFFCNCYFENVNHIIYFTITAYMFVFLIMKRIVNTHYLTRESQTIFALVYLPHYIYTIIYPLHDQMVRRCHQFNQNGYISQLHLKNILNLRKC